MTSSSLLTHDTADIVVMTRRNGEMSVSQAFAGNVMNGGSIICVIVMRVCTVCIGQLRSGGPCGFSRRETEYVALMLERSGKLRPFRENRATRKTCDTLYQRRIYLSTPRVKGRVYKLAC